jgi:hypothetical protein
MTVPAQSKRIAVSPAGVWVLSACGAESSPLHCNQLQLVGPARSQSRVVKRTLPDGVDKALAYAAGSLWAAGGGEGRVSIGTVMRIQPGRLSIEKTWSFTDVTPTDIVEAYGDVWVLDRQRNRVLRIDPATNRVKYVELRTEGLGLVSADRMVVANGAIVIVSRCCGTSRGYSQLGTVNKDGLFTTFFSTIGQLTVASDGSNLWVSTRKGSLTRYRPSGVMRHSASWFVDLDAHYQVRAGLLFATSGSVWSVAPNERRPQRVDLRDNRVDTPVELPRGPVDVAHADVAVASDRHHAWLLDGTRSVVYELRDS